MLSSRLSRDTVDVTGMVKQGGRMAENSTRRFARDLFGALAFLHDKNILHWDIKPANVLIMEGGCSNGCAVHTGGLLLSLSLRSAGVTAASSLHMAQAIEHGQAVGPANGRRSMRVCTCVQWQLTS